MPIITLTTDFGTRDGYVGAVKGVLATSSPAETQLVDIAHDIPPGDVAHAAWVVRTACRYFPPGTIHLVVVDPGVGGPRAELAVEAGGHWYVGPNNGSFAYLLDLAEHGVQIPDNVRKKQPAATFHGRDVFAYAAAWLARGNPMQGAPIALEGLPFGVRPDGAGRVIHVDHFGNLITDLPMTEAGDAVAIAGQTLTIRRTYSDVPTGQLVAYIGSYRTVEIAVRDGRADKRLDAPRGTPIVPVADPSGPFR